MLDLRLAGVNVNLASLAAVTLLVFFVIAALPYYFGSRRLQNFPPGPKTFPFLGNLHQLPLSKAFVQFHRWTADHGDIIGLKFGPQNVVVLNSYRHVKELFDKRGALYSSRPENYIGNTLLCPNDIHILLVPYGPQWRKLRKVVQALLNVTAVDNILPIQNAEAAQTLHQILTDPAGYYDHIRRYSTAVILASVFGQRGERFDSPNVQALYHAQDQFTAILEPGATPPIDAFPFLKHLPNFISPWKQKAMSIRREQQKLYLGLLQETKDRIAKGKGNGCFMAKIIQDQEKTQLNDEQVAYLGGILMEAGSDTTASTLLSFLVAMVKHPHCLQQIQNEIDGVCGSDRSPVFEDLPRLPYLGACMTETLRWRPVAAGGIPHVLTQDDVYEGYVFPKGTMFFANAWAIHRDESEYDDPEAFVPERFFNNKFGTKKTENTSIPDDHRRATYGFGAGRRVCPGQRLAENSLMVNMAKLAWAFNMMPTSEEVDTSIETGYHGGFLICPKKFPISFVPRSVEHEKTIRAELEGASAFLKSFT